MKEDFLVELLLIKNNATLSMAREMKDLGLYLVLPLFLVAIVWQYVSEHNFGEVIKRAILILVSLSVFNSIHSELSHQGLKEAGRLLYRVSPRNYFVKKWNESKLSTDHKKEWGSIEKFVIPNLNDLVATGFFVLSKAFIWLLKLVYSTFYHLTLVFSSIAAVLFFFDFTSGSLRGLMMASLWCVVMPFVVASLIIVVGESFQYFSSQGEMVVSHIDHVVWLFGVTLLLMISPAITWGLIRGEGVSLAMNQIIPALQSSLTQLQSQIRRRI